MSYSELKQVENDWVIATNRANELYHKDNYKDAAIHYLEAVVYSDLLLKNADNTFNHSIHISNLFFVSCQNLANNYKALGDFDEARTYLVYNVWQLKKFSNNNNISDDSLKEASNNWKKAVLLLMNFYRETNQPLTIDFWNEETYSQIKTARQLLVQAKANLN